LYYIISEQSFTDYLTRHAKGSAYPAVDSETIEKADFLLPPEPEQTTIADVLSAYDDLIENNSRRIQILEQMAQEIYTEWLSKKENISRVGKLSDVGKLIRKNIMRKQIEIYPWWTWQE